MTIPRRRQTGTESMRIQRPQRPTDLGPRAGLVLLYAPNFLRLPTVIPFDEDEITLGSAAPSTFLLVERAVTGTHAAVTRDGDGWRLGDRDSRNGVLVNGCFVRSARLVHGDEVRLGDALFKFVAAEIDAYRPLRIDGAMSNETPEAHAERARCPVVGGVMMRRIVRQIEDVAPMELKVLLHGETGTGKELFAHHLHAESRRPGELIAVNCAAIPESIAEATLFGARRGAFSGADRDTPGVFRAAHRGTLFLDEIGELSLEVQAKLLRVLQKAEVTPVGSTAAEPVDVRIVCATHRDLKAMEDAGTFRRDLRARLLDFPVDIPPLRDHKEDIYALVRTLLTRRGWAHMELDMPCWTALFFHDYPGNVRELEAALSRAAFLASREHRAVIGVSDLTVDIQESMSGHEVRASRTSSGVPPTLVSPGDEDSGPPPRERLRELLVEYRGNVADVARALGRARPTVRRWLVQAGFRLDDYRASVLDGAPRGTT